MSWGAVLKFKTFTFKVWRNESFLGQQTPLKNNFASPTKKIFFYSLPTIEKFCIKKNFVVEANNSLKT
jgi:hypothetical protein